MYTGKPFLTGTELRVHHTKQKRRSNNIRALILVHVYYYHYKNKVEYEGYTPVLTSTRPGVYDKDLSGIE